MLGARQAGIKVWRCVEPVGFRQQSTGLASVVQATLAMDPFSAQLLVFTHRRRRPCPILSWERCGLVLWQTRLERARFAWPRNAETGVTVTGVALNFVLDGDDIWPMRAHAHRSDASRS